MQQESNGSVYRNKCIFPVLYIGYQEFRMINLAWPGRGELVVTINTWNHVFKRNRLERLM